MKKKNSNNKNKNKLNDPYKPYYQSIKLSLNDKIVFFVYHHTAFLLLCVLLLYSLLSSACQLLQQLLRLLQLLLTLNLKVWSLLLFGRLCLFNHLLLVKLTTTLLCPDHPLQIISSLISIERHCWVSLLLLILMIFSVLLILSHINSYNNN